MSEQFLRQECGLPWELLPLSDVFIDLRALSPGAPQSRSAKGWRSWLAI